LRRAGYAGGVLFSAGFAFAQPTALAPADRVAPTFTRTIYLVRHGAYDLNEKGDEDVAHGLTPLGIAQARLVADRLHGLPVTFTTLTASTMKRAKETAQVVAQSLPQLTLDTTPLLRECLPRTWRTEVIKKVKPEALDAAEAQLNQAFDKFFVPANGADQHDILVCHGNVIRYFVTKALGVDTQAWLGFTVAHCSLTVIQVSSKRTFKVLAVGDVGHIPANMQSGTTSADLQLRLPGAEPANARK
jgi:serine/threonine-protein phosphatase PGAM5